MSSRRRLNCDEGGSSRDDISRSRRGGCRERAIASPKCEYAASMTCSRSMSSRSGSTSMELRTRYSAYGRNSCERQEAKNCTDSPHEYERDPFAQPRREPDAAYPAQHRAQHPSPRADGVYSSFLP
eukprot:scaffold295501_cov33-Tisochrysis_lutea.AAC.1